MGIIPQGGHLRAPLVAIRYGRAFGTGRFKQGYAPRAEGGTLDLLAWGEAREDAD
ncbi:MAG: hypothetical protein ACI4QD_03465 [Kiritimatiellia bacterium]